MSDNSLIERVAAVAEDLISPDDFTIDQYHPDVEGADPGGNRDKVVAQKLGSALFAELGMESPVPVGAFFDVFPLSVITTSTLARLNELRPQSRFEPRRFRMNLIVRTEQPGFVENGWVGHKLQLGDETRVNVALLDPRCVMTTLAQDDLPQDTDVLRTLVRHNRVQRRGLRGGRCAGTSTNWRSRDRCLMTLRDRPLAVLRLLTRRTPHCDFGNYLAELLAPFLPYPRASSYNAMLARQDMPKSGQNLILCDALVASERRLGP